MADRLWSNADRELVAQAIAAAYRDTGCAGCCCGNACDDHASVAVLDALTAAGWEPRCDCDGVGHDLPILRSHIRGEPGCDAAIDAGSLPEGSDEGSGNAD